MSSIFSNSKLLRSYIRKGYTASMSCTRTKNGEVWNIGLQLDVFDEYNDFTGWGRTYHGALARICQSIRKHKATGKKAKNGNR